MILELQGSGKVGHRGVFSLLSFSSLFLFVFNSPLRSTLVELYSSCGRHGYKSRWRDSPKRNGCATQRRKVIWAQKPEAYDVYDDCGRLPLSSCPRR